MFISIFPHKKELKLYSLNKQRSASPEPPILLPKCGVIGRDSVLTRDDIDDVPEWGLSAEGTTAIFATTLHSSFLLPPTKLSHFSLQHLIRPPLLDKLSKQDGRQLQDRGARREFPLCCPSLPHIRDFTLFN
jgi:hypothetical protein